MTQSSIQSPVTIQELLAATSTVIVTRYVSRSCYAAHRFTARQSAFCRREFQLLGVLRA